MSTAHDEIDQIHETEKAAKQRIDAAQMKARKIHEKADEEAKKIVEAAEKEANETATRKLNEIQSKKVEIESQVFKETEKEIKKIQADAQKKRDDAYQAVIKILLGEA